MRVRCIATEPNQTILDMLGEKYFKDQEYDIRVGKEYLVLGIVFYVRSSILGTCAAI